MSKRAEKVAEKIIAVFAVALGLAFFYVPLFDFIESQSRQGERSEAEKADISSIQKSPDQAAMTEVVTRLMARPDIARVHVLQGEYDYPSFEIKRGKNAHPGDIKRHVNHQESGLSVYIGYNTAPTSSVSNERSIKDSIRSIGSLTGGMFLTIMGLTIIFSSSGRMLQRAEEQSPHLPPPLRTETSPRPPAPDKADPVRYEGLKLVKGDD
jgi:hypothetical protein